ncbi:MAG TPA: ABC transporter substrate-binding protein [Rubrivivax sp.]|nr:ABC transporter substrate-binding protein [Rubrivivax sp.]
MKRRAAIALAGGALSASAALPALQALAATEPVAGAAGGVKVLRVMFPVAETGFDPPRLSDIYSRTVTAHIFDALYDFDHLARPVKLRPRAAAGMPEISADFTSWTVRIRPGILFDNDPAFKGRPRELTAQDFVYSIKRFADPATNSPAWSSLDDFGMLGLRELRARALKDKTPFDYDTEIEGLRALDRYTLRLQLRGPKPRLAESLADSGLIGAVAREVVEFYGDRIMEHPVGTGPFRLAKWRRSSQMVLERNPNFRDERWDADPAPDDAEGQAIAQRLRGRRVPLVDRVEVNVIEEAQPRWLSFLNAQVDMLAVPQEFVPVAVPGGQLAPNLRKLGIRHQRVLVTNTQLSFFNMEHPLVGGLEPHKVALRRAINLATNTERLVRLAFRGQGIPAQSIIAPSTSGYRADFRSENGEFSPARAKALLDLYGYVDRDGDGWREQPDGQPLLLECSTQPEGLSRQIDELMKKDMDAIGLRLVFKPAKWPENLKAARAGKLMMWRVGTSASVTDGQEVLQRLYGPQAGLGNLARFRLKAFDEVYERMSPLPDGPERQALFDRAKRLSVAYAPYKVLLHQYADTLVHPWLDGYRRPLFWNHWWHMVDIDGAKQPSRQA